MKGIDPVLIQAVCEECFYTEEARPWNEAVLSFKGSYAACYVAEMCGPLVWSTSPSLPAPVGDPRTPQEPGNSPCLSWFPPAFSSDSLVLAPEDIIALAPEMKLSHR